MSDYITMRTLIILITSCAFVSFQPDYCCSGGFAEATNQLSELLSTGDPHYDIIHKIVVDHQVNSYRPAQKSTHTRASRSLDGIYDFCLDESQLGFRGKWHSHDLQSECGQGNFYRMPVPSAFNEVTSNGTVRNYVGWFWYQTQLDVAPLIQAPKTGRKYIQFEGVNYLALVWVQPLSRATMQQDRNPLEEAHLVGAHAGGYLPFIVNLTSALTGDEPLAVRLTIAVSNNLTSETIPSGDLLDLSPQVGREFRQFKPDFDFFHFAGIMGSVNLLQLPRIHISEVRQKHRLLSNCIEPPQRECSNYLAEFEVYPHSDELELADSCGLNYKYALELWLKEQLLTRAEVVSQRCEPASISVPVNESLLWQPANGRPDYFAPQLRARVTLMAHGFEGYTLMDEYEFKVGFRPDPVRLFEGRQLQGFGLHQEEPFSGRTVSRSAILKDIYLLKQWGANIIRTSHYPYSADFLEACQENGIPVIGECAAVGLKSFSADKLRLHKQLLREMMLRDQNNAAIVGWSVANEPQSQLKEARPYFESLLGFAREDLHNYTRAAGRFLTAAIAQSHQDDTIGHLLDVIMVNRYFGWYETTGVVAAIRRPLLQSLAGWARKHPWRQLMISEFGADTLAGLHSLSGEIFSEEFQTELVAEHERVFDELFRMSGNGSAGTAMKFIGSMAWNFADFSTDVSLLRVGGNRKGLFSRDRRPKAAAHELRKIYLARLGAVQLNGATNRHGLDEL